MPMKPEEHEAILNELLQPDIDQGRRTELLGNLRADYGTVISEHTEFETNTKKLQEEKEILLVTNSQLFRERGLQQYPEEQEKEKEKEQAESISISDIEKKLLGGL